MQRDRLTALIFMLALAVPAAAQENGVPLDLAIDLDFGKPLNADCSMTADEVSVDLDSCAPPEWSVGGEFAAHVTDHVAPFIRASWTTTSLNTTACTTRPSARFRCQWMETPAASPFSAGHGCTFSR